MISTVASGSPRAQPPAPGGAGNKRPEVREKDIEGLKFFNKLRPLLQGLHGTACERDKAGNRTLHMDQHVMLILLFLFNPTLTSLRGIQQASTLKKVQKKLGCARVSLGSLSEANRVFDASLLEGVIAELGQQLAPIHNDGRLGDLQHTLTMADRSLLQGLEHLLAASVGPEAAWKAKGKHRLHAQFRIDKSVPTKLEVRPDLGAEHHEIQVLGKSLEAGLTYVMDRGYAKYELFNGIVEAGSSYACRIRDNSTYDVLEDRTLSEEAIAAGVLEDTVVEMGQHRTGSTGPRTR